MVKNCKFTVILIQLIFSFKAFSTSFVPISLEKQVDDSYAVVKVKFTGLVYKKLPSGEVVTVGSFNVLESAGLKPNEIINKNNFEIMYPGGIWNNVVYDIQGSPDFKDGEESLLLINKGKFGYYLPNLSMSKYNFKTKDGLNYISSSVFPFHEHLGQIKLDKLNEVLIHRYNEPLTTVMVDKAIHNNQEEKRYAREKREASRGPASVEDDSNDVNKMSMMWLVILFSLLGVYPHYSHRRKK